MYSCAWRNGQYQEVGPHPQAVAHLSNDPRRNQQAATGNSCQYRTVNATAHLPQNEHFIFHRGALSNGQGPTVQTSALHQTVSSQHPTEGETNRYMEMHFRMQNGRIQNCLRENINGQQTTPVSAFTTRATPLPHEQAVYTSTLMPDTGHNRQTAHELHHQQNGFVASIHPSYTNGSQFSRKYSITTNSSSSEHILQQYPTQVNSTNNNQVEAASSANSKSYMGHKTSHLSSPAEMNEQVLRNQIISDIADHLRNSYPAVLDIPSPPYHSPPYRGKQLVKSNNNLQPVTQKVADNLSSNASQYYLVHNSGQSLPQTTHSVMSRPHHSIDVPAQQSIAPNALYAITVGDEVGNGGFAATASCPKVNMVWKPNQAGSLSDSSQLMKLPESTLPQRSQTVSSAANSHETREALGMHPSAKESDGSILSSPGRSSMRAVAVVQPLSQENYQDASNLTSSKTVYQSSEHTKADEFLTNCQKLGSSPTLAKNKEASYLKEASHLYTDNANHMPPNKSIRHSTTFIDCFMSSSDSAGPQKNQSPVTGPEMVPAMHVDQHVAPAAQQSVTSGVPASPHGDEKKSVTPLEANIFELSSVPTVPLTTADLSKLMLHLEKATEIKHSTNIDPPKTPLDLFWGGSCKTLANVLKTGWYKELITDVNNFCKKQVTQDAVILSHVKGSVKKQLRSYYVLKDDDVYSELPYESPWLNVNKQLDDIDNEFGYPSFLKHRLNTSCSQSHHATTDNSICVQIVTDVPNIVLSQTDVRTVDSGEEIQESTATSTETASPNNTERVDPRDPYSLQIKVLSQEEASVIFEQIQSKMSQSMDMDSQPESVVDIAAEVSDAINITPKDPKPGNMTASPIEQACCIARWMETIFGSNTSSSTCQCKNKQSDKDCTAQSPDEEEMAEEQEDKLGANGEGQVKDMENVDNPVITHSWSALCNELGLSIALTEEDNQSHSCSDEDAKDISHISINTSQSSIMLISESENLSNSGTEIQSDPEVDFVQDELKSTGSTQSCTSVSSDKAHENIPSSEETSGQAQLPSTDGAESSLETKGETQIRAMAALQTTFHLIGKCETLSKTFGNMKLHRKRPSSHDKLNSTFLKKSKKWRAPVDVDPQAALEGVSKCKKVLVDVTDGESLASSRRTVKLALFGSAQNKVISSDSRKKYRPFTMTGSSNPVQRPPEILSVILNPLKTKSSETDHTREDSLKGRLYEKWRRSFPPTKRRRRRTQQCTFAPLSGGSLKEAEVAPSLHANKPPVPFEMRTGNRNVKRCLSLKRRRSEKMKKYAVVIKKPADQERSDTGHGGDVCMPLQENNVLRFSVLPNTFSFKEGSKSGEERNDPRPEKPDPGERRGLSSSKPVMREKGTWYPNPQKKYCPLRSPSVPKTSKLFFAFQKKYMEMTKPPVDE